MKRVVKKLPITYRKILNLWRKTHNFQLSSKILDLIMKNTWLSSIKKKPIPFRKIHSKWMLETVLREFRNWMMRIFNYSSIKIVMLLLIFIRRSANTVMSSISNWSRFRKNSQNQTQKSFSHHYNSVRRQKRFASCTTLMLSHKSDIFTRENCSDISTTSLNILVNPLQIWSNG